jgi:hypothetical protein
MYLRRRQFKSFRFLRAAAVVALVMMPAKVALADGNSGDVYIMTNQSGGNSVMVFHRDASGALAFAGRFATGGNGIGTGADPLGSQGAAVLSEDARLSLAVNAGSNSVSIFAVSGDQLRLLNTVRRLHARQRDSEARPRLRSERERDPERLRLYNRL